MLVEMLLAVSLFALVSTLIYSVFWSGIKLSSRSSDSGKVLRELQMISDLLGRDLENIYETELFLEAPDKVSLVKEEGGISFITADDNVLKRVSYKLIRPDSTLIRHVLIGSVFEDNQDMEIRQQEEDRLMTLARTEESLSSDDENPLVEILSTSIVEDGFRLEYAYRSKNSGTIQWQGDPVEDQLPVAARLRLARHNQENPRQPLILNRYFVVPLSISFEDGKVQ